MKKCKQILLSFSLFAFASTSLLQAMAEESATANTPQNLSFFFCGADTPISQEEGFLFFRLPQKKTKCWDKAPTRDDNRVVTVGDLLKPYCPPAKPQMGKIVLCAYDEDDTEEKAEKLEIGYDTRPIDLTLKVTAGDEKVFVELPNEKFPGVHFEICFGTGSKDALTADTTCSNPFKFYLNSEGKSFVKNQVTILKLTNRVTYSFKTRYVLLGEDDAVLRTSAWSKVASAMPKESYSFTDLYNGKDPALGFGSGCNQTDQQPSAFLLLGLLGFALLSLRKNKSKSKRKPTACLMLILFVSSSFANASGLNFTLVGTPYLPNLDQTPAANGSGTIPPLFRCQFGKDGKDPLLPMFGVDLDWRITDAFGSLQVGAGIGYTFVFGKALDDQFSDDKTCPAKTDSPVAAHFFKLKLPQFTYALDPWKEIVPIVPFIRAGLVAQGYIFTLENSLDKPGKKAFDKKTQPIGVMFGWEVAGGLMLLLDVFDIKTSSRARSLDTYQHTYLKVEVAYSVIDNFGSGGPNLSSGFPTKDAPLSINIGLVFEF